MLETLAMCSICSEPVRLALAFVVGALYLGMSWHATRIAVSLGRKEARWHLYTLLVPGVSYIHARFIRRRRQAGVDR
jgi:hypothetical protein